MRPYRVVEVVVVVVGLAAMFGTLALAVVEFRAFVAG